MDRLTSINRAAALTKQQVFVNNCINITNSRVEMFTHFSNRSFAFDVQVPEEKTRTDQVCIR